jgi:hypothetical protein
MAAVEGDEDKKMQAFVRVASQNAARADLLCALPDDRILASGVRAIGKTDEYVALGSLNR